MVDKDNDLIDARSRKQIAQINNVAFTFVVVVSVIIILFAAMMIIKLVRSDEAGPEHNNNPAIERPARTAK